MMLLNLVKISNNYNNNNYNNNNYNNNYNNNNNIISIIFNYHTITIILYIMIYCNFYV